MQKTDYECAAPRGEATDEIHILTSRVGQFVGATISTEHGMEGYGGGNGYKMAWWG